MIRFTPLAMIACVPHLNTEHPVEPVGEWTAPENSWATSPPPAGLEGEGFDVGDIVVDVRLPDQFDDEVSVWQFFGHLVVLDVSTMWCAPCRELAETTQHTVDTYGDALQYVTVLQEDPDGDPPTTEDLGSWANVYGLSTPVLGDGTAPAVGPCDAFGRLILLHDPDGADAWDGTMRLVAFIQAFVFCILSASYIGAAIEEHHEHH